MIDKGLGLCSFAASARNGLKSDNCAGESAIISLSLSELLLALELRLFRADDGLIRPGRSYSSRAANVIDFFFTFFAQTERAAGAHYTRGTQNAWRFMAREWLPRTKALPELRPAISFPIRQFERSSLKSLQLHLSAGHYLSCPERQSQPGDSRRAKLLGVVVSWGRAI